MRPRLDALTIPDSDRYFSIDLDDWRRVQLEGAAAELAKLDEEIPPLKKEAEDLWGDPGITLKRGSVEEVAWRVKASEHSLKERRHERLTALVATLKPLPNRGLHHLKFPSFSKSNAFVQWSDTTTDPGLSLYRAALVGLFWSHRGTELDAKLPARATSDQWDEYAEAVEDELQDAGYTSQEIGLIAGQCDERMAGWLQGLTEAKKVADFTSPKGD